MRSRTRSRRALPGTDVVVHVEPGDAAAAALRERALAAALRVARVREIHNVAVLRGRRPSRDLAPSEAPGALSLDEAHDIATQLEEAITSELPEVARVQTHLEPLADDTVAQPLVAGDKAESVARIVSEATGRRPRELRLFRTERGLVVFLTLGMDAGRALAEAHADASEIEERIRSEHPEIADVDRPHRALVRSFAWDGRRRRRITMTRWPERRSGPLGGGQPAPRTRPFRRVRLLGLALAGLFLLFVFVF